MFVFLVRTRERRDLFHLERLSGRSSLSRPIISSYLKDIIEQSRWPPTQHGRHLPKGRMTAGCFGVFLRPFVGARGITALRLCGNTVVWAFVKENRAKSLRVDQSHMFYKLGVVNVHKVPKVGRTLHNITF